MLRRAGFKIRPFGDCVIPAQQGIRKSPLLKQAGEFVVEHRVVVEGLTVAVVIASLFEKGFAGAKFCDFCRGCYRTTLPPEIVIVALACLYA